MLPTKMFRAVEEERLELVMVVSVEAEVDVVDAGRREARVLMSGLKVAARECRPLRYVPAILGGTAGETSAQWLGKRATAGVG
jgi:hypothetical protein